MVSSPPINLPFRIQTIFPAVKVEINRRKEKTYYYFDEDITIYQTYTHPFIQDFHDKHIYELQWIYDILDGKSEQKSILKADKDPKTGFVLVDQTKYNKNARELLMLGIVNNRDYYSIRSLDGAESLECMKKIKDAAIEVMRDHFGLKESEYLPYVEYLPQNLHLMVYFIRVSTTRKILKIKAIKNINFKRIAE